MIKEFYCDLLKLVTITISIITALTCTSCLANDTAIMTIILESSNQSFTGQVAVANVIKTRMKQRGQTAEAICKEPYQFSAYHPITGKPTQTRKITQKEKMKALLAWKKGKVWEYNHYAHYKVKPYWVKKATKSLKVGDHVFYKL